MTRPHPPHNPQAGRFPAAFALAAAAVVAVEAAVATFGHRIDDGLLTIALAKRAAIADIAARRRPAPDTLVMGDSRMFPAEPGALAGITSGTALNLSWPMMGAEGPDVMLSAYLRVAPPPRTVYVNPPAELWALPASSIALHAQADYKARLFTAAPTAALVAELAARSEWTLLHDLAAHLAQPPTLARRPALLQWIANRAAGRREPVRTDNDRRELAEFAATGAFAMYGDATVTDASLAHVNRIVGPYGNYDNPAAQAALERFLARARDAGIQVRWLPLPMPEPLYDAWYRTGALAAAQARAMPAPDATAGTTDTLFLRWPRALFGDAVHLNRPGADRYRDYLKSNPPVFAPRP